ncbi:MAG: tRNA (adenosine(37)-N6)-dimethylallyltransferase MiaA [Bacteroidota bacterium]|nr:tRNA (adenosine(37)-N6)-dimethylallyltransferase MiaA [Bacteroidota bacterium]
MKTLVVILGPTGVGKTELCLSIAEHFGLPIINADSRQIFSELPIATAAPTESQQQRVKHYFVGNRHIEDYYSASMYEEDVMALLPKLFIDSDIALLTGGSMLYLDSVCNGIDDIPTIDAQTRAKLKRDLSEQGLPSLVDRLKELDPEHWAIVDRLNPRRVVHALEICEMTGKTYTSFRTNEKKQRPFRIVKIGLNRPREELYERINQRVLTMMESGLEAEARALYSKRALNALNTVGYKEMFAYFDGTIPLEEAVRQIQSNTRRYMRKQLTWFNKDTDIKWFSPENMEYIINYIDQETH